METSQQSLVPSLNLTSLPWANAYERPHFEHGYEQGSGIASISVTNGGTGYGAAPTMTLQCNAPCVAGGAGFAATAVITNGRVTSVNITARGSGYNPQFPPTVTFSPPGAGTTATGTINVAAEGWPVATGSQFDDHDYLYEV